MPEPVVVYTQPDCPPCDAVKAFLRARGIPYLSRDVTAEPAAAARLAALGSHSTPTLEVGGDIMVGFRTKELEDMLARAGFDARR